MIATDAGDTAKPNSAIQITSQVSSPRAAPRAAGAVNREFQEQADGRGGMVRPSLDPHPRQRPGDVLVRVQLADPIRSVFRRGLHPSLATVPAGPARSPPRAQPPTDREQVTGPAVQVEQAVQQKNPSPVSTSMPMPNQQQPLAGHVARHRLAAITGVVTSTLVCRRAKFALISSSR